MVADVYIKRDYSKVSEETGCASRRQLVRRLIINQSVVRCWTRVLMPIQMAEIASINNLVFRTLGSPLIIPADEWIRISPADPTDNVLMCDQLGIEGRPIKALCTELPGSGCLLGVSAYAFLATCGIFLYWEGEHDDIWMASHWWKSVHVRTVLIARCHADF